MPSTQQFAQCAEQQSRLADLLKRFAFELKWEEFRGSLRLVVPASSTFAVLDILKNQGGMDMLVDITAVDLLEYEGATDRFRVVYLLLNTETSERLEVNTHVNDPQADADERLQFVERSRLDRARDLRHVRHHLRRPSQLQTFVVAPRVRSLSTAKRLSSQRPR